MVVVWAWGQRRAGLLAVGACAVIVVWLAWLAGLADAGAVGGSPTKTALDLSVGVAFPVGALAAVGPTTERLLVYAVGPAWLAGSLFTSAQTLHQGVLVLALLAFPTGRVRGYQGWLLAGCAVAVAFEVVPQLGVAALFVALAGLALLAFGGTGAAAAYPAAAGAAVSAVLVFGWWTVRTNPAASTVTPYSLTLIALAVGFPWATRAVLLSRRRLADRVIGDARFTGLAGIKLVLAGVLSDPTLVVELWDNDAGRYVDSGGGQAADHAIAGELTVREGDDVLARVVTKAPAVADRPTAWAVEAAVRLAVLNRRLYDQQAQAVAAVEASRVRLLAATDKERERVAVRLRTEAGAHLEEARSMLAAADPGDDPGLAALIELASGQLEAAAFEVERIVAGTPPEELGAGRLRSAIASLAAGAPERVTLNLAADAAAGADVETTLFYVCSESLANVSRHSGATDVNVDLSSSDNVIHLVVHDNGRGGAKLSGSGLQGMMDRVAAAGGRLMVDSPQGGGTRVAVSVPISRG